MRNLLRNTAGGKAGTIVRLVPTSERKFFVAANVVLYIVLIAGLLLYPAFQPEDVAPADLQRLAATVGIWFSLVLLSELLPADRDTSESGMLNG